jgi:predicted DNA-binding protein (MmcQ/YjbR family)
MTLDDYNAVCRALPFTTHVVQWGGADVWKVAGKVFAIARMEDRALHVTFKTSPLAYEILQSEPGCRPAPYLASRGMKWIQRTSAESMSDKSLKEHLRESHRLASLTLPKARQRELGLNQN